MDDQPENGKSGWDVAGGLLSQVVGGAVEYFKAEQEQKYNKGSLDLQTYVQLQKDLQDQAADKPNSLGLSSADLMKWLPLIAIAGVGLFLILKA